MDGGVIAAIVTGGFGLTSMILHSLLTIKCVKSENEGGVKTYHVFPRCIVRYRIPRNKNIFPNILRKCWEPPDNWNFSKPPKYIKHW